MVSRQNDDYKITWLKSDSSTLWKTWTGQNDYYNVQGVLL